MFNRGPDVRIEVDSIVLSTIESCVAACSLDDVMERLLRGLMRLPIISGVEIMLSDEDGELIPVASAKRRSFSGGLRSDVRVESWLLNNPVRHTTRKTILPTIGMIYSIPLTVSDELLGVMKLTINRVSTADPKIMGKLYLIAINITAKIREMILAEEVNKLKEDRETLLSNYRETVQRSTSLSKELYTICAISTKINQSLDIDESLHKSMAKIREVFDAKSVAVFAKAHNDPSFQVSSMRKYLCYNGDGSCGASELREPAIGIPFLSEFVTADPSIQRFEREFVARTIEAGKPLIIGRENSLSSQPIEESGNDDLTLIGVPLKSKNNIQGVLALTVRGAETPSQDNIRLLCGIADIMVMAMDNMHLYLQGQEARSEAAFLAESVEEFNKKLDLKETLRAIAKKGAEFIGEQCIIYLPDQSVIPLVRAQRINKSGKTYYRSKIYHTIKYHKIESFLDKVSKRKRSTLIVNVTRSKIIPAHIKPWLEERNIESLMMVPLRIKKKEVALLVLCNGPANRAFARHDLGLAEKLGGAATVAIENARTYSASLELSDFLEKKIVEKTNEITHMVERQKAQIENRRDIIFRVNGNNRFVFANTAMERLSGISREELYRGKIGADKVVAPEDRSRLLKNFQKVLEGEITLIKDLEYRHLNRKGEDHLISLTVYPEIDEKGVIIGLEGVGRDVTEKKRLEVELAKAKDLALLGEFSGAVAHQLRNPLSNILMGAKLLQKAIGMSPPRLHGRRQNNSQKSGLLSDKGDPSQLFWNLTSGINDLNQVVTELLEYTKTLTPRFSYQQNDVILMEVLEKFQEMIKKNRIIVRHKFGAPAPPLRVDALLISQAYQNVVHNAIQAMPEGGILSVKSGAFSRNGAHTKVVISDTGVGVRQTDLERIFHPFYTTKEFGTGLGLSLAHRIVEAHGGSIWVTANKPKGTSIHILLPNKKNLSAEAETCEDQVCVREYLS